MNFTPTQFSTAADKEKFFKHFQRFVNSGYKYTLFHRWFYVQLSFMFGHIAHFNKSGFYVTFFTEPENIERFWYHVMQHGCYGDPAYTYCDVERAIQQWRRPNYDPNRDPYNHREVF